MFSFLIAPSLHIIIAPLLPAAAPVLDLGHIDSSGYDQYTTKLIHNDLHPTAGIFSALVAPIFLNITAAFLNGGVKRLLCFDLASFAWMCELSSL